MTRHTPLRSRARLESRKPLRHRSKKGAAKQRTWIADLAKAIEAAGGRCVIRIPGVCTGRAEGGHHRIKRRFNVAQEPIPACNPCNGWIEDHHDEALSLGLTIDGNGLPVRGAM